MYQRQYKDKNIQTFKISPFFGIEIQIFWYFPGGVLTLALHPQPERKYCGICFVYNIGGGIMIGGIAFSFLRLPVKWQGFTLKG